MPRRAGVHLEYFELYWEMGYSRSLAALARKLVEIEPDRKYDGALRVVETMSVKYHWQEQISQRVKEQAGEVKQRLLEQLVPLREEAVTAIRADIGRYMQKLIDTADAEKPVAANDAASLNTLLRLAFALIEEPLAERVEYTGRDGRPIELDHTLRDWDDLTDEEIGRRLTEGDNGDEPTEPDDEPDADDTEASGNRAAESQGGA